MRAYVVDYLLLGANFKQEGVMRDKAWTLREKKIVYAIYFNILTVYEKLKKTHKMLSLYNISFCFVTIDHQNFEFADAISS